MRIIRVKRILDSAAWRCHRARWWPGGAPARSQRQPGRQVRGPGLQRTTMSAPPAGAGAGADTATLARRCCLWSVLVAALGLLTAGVSALEVITPKEIYVLYGSEGELSCKFKSGTNTSVLTSISWSFLPARSPTRTSVSFFYFYHGQVYLGDHPHFKDRVTWAGDLLNKDASIKIKNMKYIHNGTYICDVKNPPDIGSQPGTILLYVVREEDMPPRKPSNPSKPPPTFPVLKWVLGIVALLLLALMVIVVILVVLYKKSHS